MTVEDMSKADLKIDWATYEAAKHAVLNWHYSQAMPGGKLVKVGAWENGKFIGVVLFGKGANCNLGRPFKLTQIEACELVRIALRDHITPVSKIVAIAIRFLKKQNPGLRLIISYADPIQGHHGGIYQAGNWIYQGKSRPAIKIWHKGKWAHGKTVYNTGVDQVNLPKKMIEGKHAYLMPLDKAMRKQILPLSKPYPKRASSDTGDTPDHQSGKGGSIPTDALQSQQEVKA